MNFTRTTVDARQLGGAPCIRGLRIPVATVVGMVADGMTTPEILDVGHGGHAQRLRFSRGALMIAPRAVGCNC